MSERADRVARRAFIAANHPDRGGDPAAFVEGLGRLDAHRLDSHRVDAHCVDSHLIEQRLEQVDADGPTPEVYRSRRIAPARWVRRWRSARRYGSRTLR